jgi:hypothetical protein
MTENETDDAGSAAEQPQTSQPAQQPQTGPNVPDEAANAEQYIHWSGRSADLDEGSKR